MRFTNPSGLVYKIFLLSSMVSLSACISFDTKKNYPSKGISLPKPISIEDTYKKNKLTELAEKEHPRILAIYGGEYINVKIEHMIAKIMARLTAATENPNLTYRVTILNSPNINAFSLPGGYLYITRGILALANDSAELASIIAHEIAHIIANHGITRKKLESEENVSEKVASELLNENLLVKTTAVHGQLKLAQFSRNQELEADAISIKLIGKAGYDTYGAQRFLQSMESFLKLGNVSKSSNTNLDFLGTHPSTPQRIQHAEYYANKFSHDKSGMRDKKTFLNGIEGLIFGNSPENGFIQDDIFYHLGYNVLFNFPKNFTIENMGQTITANGPNDMAIRFDCIQLSQKYGLKNYLQSGWITELQEDSIQETSINGFSGATANANIEKWKFNITLIRKNDTTCRLLTASPIEFSDEINNLTEFLRNNLRFFKKSEKIKFKPLRIQNITIKKGDTISSITEKMQGVDKKEDLFKVLNAIEKDELLIPDQQVKIITNAY